jgi:hypothetical protein
MSICKDNFYEAIDSFIRFPDIITRVTEENFKTVYDSESARQYKNIVYLYRSEKKIPRLVGESDIIYIGQTKTSFKTRYSRYAKLHATSKANSLKFEEIVKQYESISISVHHFSRFGKSLRLAEGQLLWWYFQNHCEYPPLNYTKTKIRNDIVHDK